MAHFDIISSQGQHPVIWSGAPKYVGAYLKPGYIEFPAIGSPTAISWHTGDYVVYTRTGKTYRLYRTPQTAEQATASKYGAAFLYENVQFYDDSKQLEFCPFTDLVPGDNTIHFSTANTVSFFGKPANVAERLQACLENQYGAGTWEVRIVTTTDADLLEILNTEIEFSVSGANCLEVLDKVYNEWSGLGWIHTVESGVNVITIGASNVRTNANTTDPFAYDNGLVRVERSIANADQIGTRLFAYGSMKNMDATYYRGLDIYQAESVDIEHLMIPIANWGTTDSKPDARKAFIDNATAIAALGLIPRTAYFDGTGELPDIHPTIERMTIGEVYNAGGAGYLPDLSKWSVTDRIDVVVSATNPTDHGTSAEQGQKYAEIITSHLDAVSASKAEGQLDQKVWEGTTTKAGRLTIKLGQNNQTFTMMSGWTNPEFSSLQMEVLINGSEYAFVPIDAVNSGATTWTVKLPETVTIKDAPAGTVAIYVFGYVLRNNSDTYANARTYTFSTDATTPVGAKVEYELSDTFVIRIPQIGFDIDDYAALGEGKTVSFKTGMCAGRDFVVKDAAYVSSADAWDLTLYRSIDEDLNIMFPNADYEVAAGDQYVLLDIAMPDMYVTVASSRLLAAAQKLLADISVEKPFYSPQIDAKRVYNESRVLREGMWMDITLNGDQEYVIIDSITIDENGSNIPTYEVALRQDKGIEWTENIGKSGGSKSSKSVAGGEEMEADGTVTSVAVEVPTGLDVEGSPITTRGVIRIKLASGYKIPLESELTQFFETDSGYTDGVKMKAAYSALKVPGLKFNNGSNALDLQVVNVAAEGEAPVYALRSALPFFSESWISAGGVSSGGGQAPGNASMQLITGGGRITNGTDTLDVYSMANTYTKQEVDSLIASAGTVQTVAGVSPTNGDIPVASLSTALGLGAAAGYAVASSVTQNDTTHLVTGAAVWSAIDALPEPMVFKGSLGTGGTITTLPTASSANEGFTYKVITAGTYAGQAAKVGDLFISNGSAWIWIPSGDEPSGTVTSVGLSVPTGLSVSGSPITTSGTLAITFATGYSIPLTADVNKGVTAYGYFDSNAKVKQANLPTMYIGTTAVQFSSAAQALTGITTITATGQAEVGSLKLASGTPTLTWDNDHSAWHLSGNFYADGFISAGGISSGGGTGGIDLAAMWASLQNNDNETGYHTKAIHTDHLPSITGVLTGTYTSQWNSDHSVLTTSLSLAAATGYYIPSTTDQSNWNAKWDSSNHPTTLANYGITDAYISSGTIYLGNNSITPLTSAPVTSVAGKTGAVTLAFSDITGTASTAQIPDLSGTYVTLNTDQTINSTKTFVGNVHIRNSYTRISILPWSNETYIESMTADGSANAPLWITGKSGAEGSSLYLDFANIYATSSQYTVLHSGNYSSYALPLTGGNMTGMINKEGGNFLNFRTGHTNYNAIAAYYTPGNEALVFGLKNAVTSFIVKSGVDLTDKADWQESAIGTPSIQIKGQSLYVNSAIANYETPSYNLYVGGTIGTSGQITSTVATGTAPFVVASTTNVTNLNADLLDGQHGSYYAAASSLSNYLPLTGGTIEQDALNPLNINNTGITNANYVIEYFRIGGTTKAAVGYTGGSSGMAFVGYEETNAPKIGVNYAGVPQFWTNYDQTQYNLYHSGNSNTSSVPWTCSVLTVGTTAQSSFAAYVYGQTALAGYMLVGYGGTAGTGAYAEGIRLYGASTSGSYITVVFGAELGQLTGFHSNQWQLGRDSSNQFFLNHGGSVIWTIDTSNNWSITGNFSANGAVTAGSASDARLKENIKTISHDSARDLIMALRPVTFKWNALATSLYDKYEGADLGFVAQEVEPLMPMAISTIFNDYKRLDQTKFIAPLVAVAQSHETRIQQLERENKELKEELKRLRS